MKRIVLILFIVVSSFSFGGNALIVGVGGYTSCGEGGPGQMGLAQLIFNLKSSVENKGYQTEFILACLYSDPPPTGSMDYLSSENPGNAKRTDLDGILSLIEDLSRRDTQIILIGHSYGGWSVMYLAQRLSAIRKLATLFTLDPISPKTCGPLQVVLGGSGCHQAPRDLNNSLILRTTRAWLNFFQTQDTWITSSAIPEAENYRVVYRGPHGTVDNDERVWKVVDQAALKNLSREELFSTR